MIERRPVEKIVDEWHAAERELAPAPEERWLENCLRARHSNRSPTPSPEATMSADPRMP